jgi:UDP-N-acetylglucosamine 2-epimerase
MRLILFAGPEESAAAALEAAGVEAEERALPSAAGPEAAAELIAGLRGAEEALAGDPPDVVLVAGAGDAALGVALTAVKLQLPTGWLCEGDAEDGALVASVVDESLDATADAGDLSSQVRDLAARKLLAP